MFAVLMNGKEYRKIIDPPEGQDKYIAAETPIGGKGYIEGWMRGLKNGAVCIAQPLFQPPQPQKTRWNLLNQSIYSGNYRSWDRGTEMEQSVVAVGSTKIYLFDRK